MDGTSQPPLLGVEGLAAGYHKKTVLESVTFHVREGERVAVVGRNGAGKTTLLHALLGVLPVTSGTIAYQGRNLNREWRTPDEQASPEVLHVRNAMEATGCELFLDIHGDEALPWVFFSTAEEVPGFTAEAAARQARLVAALSAASPDFQTEHGYKPGRFGEELLSLASKWVAWHFNCVSLTLEMPFKDNANLPDGQVGWSAARSKRLGAAMVTAVLAHLDKG